VLESRARKRTRAGARNAPTRSEVARERQSPTARWFVGHPHGRLSPTQGGPREVNPGGGRRWQSRALRLDESILMNAVGHGRGHGADGFTTQPDPRGLLREDELGRGKHGDVGGALAHDVDLFGAARVRRAETAVGVLQHMAALPLAGGVPPRHPLALLENSAFHVDTPSLARPFARCRATAIPGRDFSERSGSVRRRGAGSSRGSTRALRLRRHPLAKTACCRAPTGG
jgi:hypothetical protein